MKFKAAGIAIGVVVGVAGIAVISKRAAETRSLLRPQVKSPIATARAATSSPKPCLESGAGFFKAQLDGAFTMDLQWHNDAIACEGEPRPDGKGLRLSFAAQPAAAAVSSGPTRIVIGIAGVSEGSSGQALPANLTIMDERRQKIFGTLGDDKCTVDSLRQTLLGAWRKEGRAYEVSGRGFCMQPARAVAGDERLLISTFDFTGQVIYR